MDDILDVYLDGQFTGQLSRKTSGEVSFEYAHDQGTSLSVSMPRSVGSFLQLFCGLTRKFTTKAGWR